MSSQKFRTKAEEKEELAQYLCKCAKNGYVLALHKRVTPENVNVKFNGATPLMNSIFCDSEAGLSCFRFLLEANANPAAADAAGKTALHLAVLRNRIPHLLLLLERQPKLVNAQTQLGETPLMWAAAVNRIEAAKLLMKFNADILAKNKMGLTATDIANNFESWSVYHIIASSFRSLRQRLDIVELTIHKEKEAKRLCTLAWKCELQQLQKWINLQNCNCRWRSLTPMMWVARAVQVFNSIDAECLVLLLELGASPYRTDWQGWTVCHYAAAGGKVDILNALPPKCLSVADNEGRTPLMLAASRGQDAAVAALVKLGAADVAATNAFGRTALAIAESARHPITADLLKELV